MFKIKKGDNVKVMSGKDKGKQGKVAQVLPEINKLVVEGVNKLKKHLKPSKQREKGQRVEFDAPMNASNVQLVCPKCAKVTRVGFKILADKKKVRVCRKCKEIL
ncbi:MAG: 50S ribosomal protein L24 [Patescibacteria group bacterium]|jgi:large subunit ribosomal protein L24